MTNGDDDRETTALTGGRGGLPAGGEFLGVPWTAEIEGEQVRLTIGGRPVHVVADGIGSFVTHEMFGRWSDLRELARMMIRYHPEYSPLARRHIA